MREYVYVCLELSPLVAPENYFRGINFNNLLVFVIFLIIEVYFYFYIALTFKKNFFGGSIALDY